MAEKPRLLVIERDTPEAASARRPPGRTVTRSSAPGPWPGPWSCSASRSSPASTSTPRQLSAVRWAGVLIQADEILDAIADGVAVVDPDLQIIWANPEFHSPGRPRRSSRSAAGSTGRSAIAGGPRARSPARSPRPSRRGPRPARRSGSTPTATSGSRSRPSSTARGRLDPPDRPDPRHHRRDPPAAEDHRHPQGGRRAGRPHPRGARRDGGRGADRPPEVQHRPPHEGPARARLHRDPPARPDRPAGSSRS